MTKKFNWAEFLIGLLLILTAIATFYNPAGSLASIVMFLAIAAIIKGIIELFIRRNVKNLTGSKNTTILIIGIVDILFGIFLLFNISAGMISLPYIFAAWFIADSIAELSVAGIYKEISTGYYWFKIIINILGILLGFLLLFNPLSSALTLVFLVGTYFMISGIDLIIAAF